MGWPIGSRDKRTVVRLRLAIRPIVTVCSVVSERAWQPKLRFLPLNRHGLLHAGHPSDSMTLHSSKSQDRLQQGLY
jgi:hypothetical protein